MTTKQQNAVRLYAQLTKLGFSMEEIASLIRIERTLQRWGELECGNSNDYNSWCISRDEDTGKPYMEYHSHSSNASRREPIADREAGALKRLNAIMASRKRRLIAYHQGDPRGCALYIVRKRDIPKGESVDAYYTRGIAVCI